MDEKVKIKLKYGIATITLNNPPLNVVTRELTEQLGQLLKQVATNSEVRVVILTGDGNRPFCAGSDIKEFKDLIESGEVISKKLAMENYVYDMLARLPQPTIAAINGMALGGGAELALCCDIRVMDSSAKIGFPECKLGVFPGSGGTQRLPQLVGESKAKELMYIGDPINAETALQIGLVNRISSPGESLDAAMEMAMSIAKRSGKALESIKIAVEYGLIAGNATGQAKALELSDEIFNSDDVREGVSAFFEKRAPLFKHC
jgi:enoyl-CoA hydratase